MGNRINGRMLEIENQARSLQIEVFRSIWNGQAPQDVTDIFEPGIALSYLGYSVCSVPEIGRHRINGVVNVVAGIILQDKKIVTIAEMNFSYPTKRFTVAHELGHAGLHQDMPALHRDVPLERSGTVQDWREIEANRFASAYLMPRKLVHERFYECFGIERFELTDATAFALCGTCDEEVQKIYRNPRQLSQHLSGAGEFNGHYFKPLYEQFKVSLAAMAIRLEELEITTTA
jgi:Zn-dependent peptidase ImmA (M78 family)